MIFLFTTARVQAILFAAILIGYWGLLTFVPAPETGKAGDFAKATRTWPATSTGTTSPARSTRLLRYGDNEGLLSTIPAIRRGHGAAGRAGRPVADDRIPALVQGRRPDRGRLRLPRPGMLWGLSFPIIKILWTSTYVLVAGGWSLILLGLFYAIIDVLKVRSWAYFFVVIGVNAITIYMA